MCDVRVSGVFAAGTWCVRCRGEVWVHQTFLYGCLRTCSPEFFF